MPVEFITSVRYDDSVWMKVRGDWGEGSALLVGCVYMLTDSSSVAVVDSCCDKLKEGCTGI